MLQIYAAWIEGAEDEDIETIKRAMHATERNQPATEAEPKSPSDPWNLAVVSQHTTVSY
jgi:hypothetical protein